MVTPIGLADMIYKEAETYLNSLRIASQENVNVLSNKTTATTNIIKPKYY